MLNIALIDDNMPLLDYLKKELEALNNLKILFTAYDGADCMRKLEAELPENHPHILLMDIAMPKLDGISATFQITRKYPHIQVVIFTSFEDDDKILACIQAGAKGYLLKSEKIGFIHQTLEEVMQGGSQMTPSVARKVFKILAKNTPKTQNLPAPAPPITKLTARENEILDFVKMGYKYKKIAETLSIEEATVKKHIRNIYEKLDVHDKFEAIQYKK